MALSSSHAECDLRVDIVSAGEYGLGRGGAEESKRGSMRLPVFCRRGRLYDVWKLRYVRCALEIPGEGEENLSRLDLAAVSVREG
jgi:hypothetical protein